MRISDWSSDVCSSDLEVGDARAGGRVGGEELRRPLAAGRLEVAPQLDGAARIVAGLGHQHQADVVGRSEEHTSELQSLMRISYAVFCLKKKNKTNTGRLHVIS